MDQETRPDARASKVFLSSSGYDFNGETLSPFSPQRQAVATAMGMHWPFVQEEDEITLKIQVPIPPEELEKIPKKKRADGTQTLQLKHYRQSFKDSVIALWLCAQTESRVLRAERKPEEAMSDAWAWAKKIGLNQSSELAGNALALWLQITNEIAESKGEPRAKEGSVREENDSSEEL